ncbi:S1 family peptidase [Streptomyces sp. NPDC085614]|uniref:S1 family peptidase n=1 Tax=Streptomyces sp. NPDC085614 TaxID=3365733 RepID=UPI0037D34EEC
MFPRATPLLAIAGAVLMAGAIGVSTSSAAGVSDGNTCKESEKSSILCTLDSRTLQDYKKIQALDWHPDAKKATFFVYANPEGTHLEATFDPGWVEIGKALEAELHGNISIKYEGVSRFSGGRTGDASPHWGGAEILGLSDFCTAGFSVVFPSGARGSVTAGHCYENGDAVASGLNYYGSVHGESNFPTYDMIAISSGGSYTNKIYTDPGNPISRTVTGKGDPVVNSSVCTSGRLTKAACGGVVTSLSGSLYQGGGWTTGLIVIHKPGSVIGRPTDSGGPVYSPSGINGAAIIRGMIVGGSMSGDTVLAEKVSNIESHLGVTVLTAP